ncbi:MAG: TetR family transcriptional regulator [Gemmatimonadota bacterium]|jgi:AcrR family transcriptional regulator
MAQYLKEEVRDRIRAAALGAFASEGYAEATMAGIAAAAGVSAGNLYRYFESKEDLFDAVVPRRLVRRFRRLLSERLRGAEGERDVRDLGPEHRYWLASGELFDFVLQHRLEVIAFLGRGRGTAYERVHGEVVDELVDAATRHSAALAGSVDGRATLAFDLEQIYRNFVDSLVRILKRFESNDEIREAVGAYERYHLAGLAALLP